VLDVTGLGRGAGLHRRARAHSDIALLSSPFVPSKIQQGITTEVIGNCGLAVAPLRADTESGAVPLAAVHRRCRPGVAWRWRTVADYLAAVESAGSAMKYRDVWRVTWPSGQAAAALTTGRHGGRDRPDAADDRAGACRRCRRAVMRTHVPPNSTRVPTSLVALGEVIASPRLGVTFHLRDYADQLLESVREALTVASRSGCRVQISHLTVVGRRNWARSRGRLT